MPGELTARIAREITRNWEKQGYDVFYDHGKKGVNKNVGKIVSSIGETPFMGEELSQLDIAVVERETNKVAALIEIEETSDAPKIFIGDIFGILMGKSISFRGNINKAELNDWKIGNWTTLIVVGNGKNHNKRNEHIQEMALKAKSSLGTTNSKVGDIIVISKSFSTEDDLKELLLPVLDRAFKGGL